MFWTKKRTVIYAVLAAVSYTMLCIAAPYLHVHGTDNDWLMNLCFGLIVGGGAAEAGCSQVWVRHKDRTTTWVFLAMSSVLLVLIALSSLANGTANMATLAAFSVLGGPFLIIIVSQLFELFAPARWRVAAKA